MATTTEEIYSADSMVMAIPAKQLLSMLGESLIAMAFDEKAFPGKLQGSGFVVPRDQGLRITACTQTSEKWPHTAPTGQVLLRAYIGHAGDQSHIMEHDATLRAAYGELARVYHIQEPPIFYEVSRHPASMPQYMPGHLERIERLEDLLSNILPGIVCAGGSYRGVGIPDCIQQGRDAAKKLLATP
jgi:oxygen-dependent protoporphyrinogen oxidase